MLKFGLISMELLLRAVSLANFHLSVAMPQFTMVHVSATYTQGKLVLTNGVTVEGTFGGKWLKRVEIQKAVLEDPVEHEDNVLPGSVKELQYVCMYL